MVTRGGGGGVSAEAVEDIDITLGVHPRETLLPVDVVDMVDICQWHGPVDGRRRRGSEEKLVPLPTS